MRSLKLDAWELEILKVMAELGNTVVNEIYEKNVPKTFVRAIPKSDRWETLYFSWNTDISLERTCRIKCNPDFEQA